MSCLSHWLSPLGPMTIASDGESIIGLWFDGQAHFGSTLRGENSQRYLPVLRDAERWLEIYFSGAEPDFTPPLALPGTDFQRRVWARLRDIPRGQTLSYGELAACLGSSPRAVGQAVGRNPVSLMVPCHRVIAADGSLAGYAGGRERKRSLLLLEGVSLLF